MSSFCSNKIFKNVMFAISYSLNTLLEEIVQSWALLRNNWFIVADHQTINKCVWEMTSTTTISQKVLTTTTTTSKPLQITPLLLNSQTLTFFCECLFFTSQTLAILWGPTATSNCTVFCYSTSTYNTNSTE